MSERTEELQEVERGLQGAVERGRGRTFRVISSWRASSSRRRAECRKRPRSSPAAHTCRADAT